MTSLYVGDISAEFSQSSYNYLDEIDKFNNLQSLLSTYKTPEKAIILKSS